MSKVRELQRQIRQLMAEAHSEHLLAIEHQGRGCEAEKEARRLMQDLEQAAREEQRQ